MAADNTPLNQKKILVSVYALIAIFLSASLGIVIYFSVVTALSSEPATDKAGSSASSSAAGASIGNQTSNHIFDESFRDINQIYYTQKHAEALSHETDLLDVHGLEVASNGSVHHEFEQVFQEEGVEEEKTEKPSGAKKQNYFIGEIVHGLPKGSVHHEFEQVFRRGGVEEEKADTPSDAKKEDNSIVKLELNNGSGTINNLFGNSGLCANLLFNDHFQADIKPISFSSYSAFHDLVNSFNMNLFPEFSVLTNKGCRVTVLIAGTVRPSNITQILEAIRTGNNIPNPSGNYFILYYERALGGILVEASLSQKYKTNFVEFKEPFGFQNLSALVLSQWNIDLTNLDPKIMSSESLFAQFAAEKRVPEIVKNTFLVDGLEHIFILATSEKKQSDQVIEIFAKLLSWLDNFNFGDDKCVLPSEKAFLIAIVYPSSKVGLEYFRTVKASSVAKTTSSASAPAIAAPSPIICPLSAPLELQTTDYIFLKYLKSTFKTMVFAVRNVFGTKKRALLFKIIASSLKGPDPSEFSNQFKWINPQIRRVNSPKYDVFIKRKAPSPSCTDFTPIPLDEKFVERIASKLADIASQVQSELLNRQFFAALKEKMDWPEEELEILVVPK